MIKVPIEIGDIVRVGRFKNKRVEVKTIEYDENGLPIINGRPLLTMRIEKLMEPKTEASAGLWANIRAKQARGGAPARKGSDAYKKAKSAADRINATNEITISDSFAVKLLEAIKASKMSLTEAEYQGRTVKLGKPMQGDVKKFKVYVKNPKGNVVKVNFGQKGMSIKKSNPDRRRSFRARHNCDSPGPRDKARYWSCRKW